MNLAWILLLAQVAVPHWHILGTPSTHDCDDPNGYIFTPADPPQHELRVWKDTDGVYHAINWIGQEIRSDGKPQIVGDQPCVDTHLKPLGDVLPNRIVFIPPNQPQPEPMDVPAVQEPTKRPPDCSSIFGDDKPSMWRIPSGQNLECSSKPPLVWTCRDKTRVLLTSENGDKHCIKFPK